MGIREKRKERAAARENERFLRARLDALEVRPEESRKQERLAYLKMERRKLRIWPRKSFAERLLDQAAWLSRGAWLGQAAVLLFFCWLLRNADWSRRETLLVVSWCTPLFGAVGLIELLRSWQNDMWELEECCRYHLRQIQGMRLLVFGIVDSAAAAVIFGLGLTEGYTVEMLLLFFLFPLLISDSVFLLLAKFFRRGARGLVPILGAFAMGLFWAYQSAWIQDIPGVLEGYMSPLALLLLLAFGTGLLAFSCAYFLNGTEKEEQKQWSYV